MSYHGDNGWGADYATRDVLVAAAHYVQVGTEQADAEVTFTKKRQGRDDRLLKVEILGHKAVFFLDRDGIENLKLFLAQ